ncbi:S1/P1 nuclease (plasmid) [Mesorhizobium sp. AR10]|uniref:S1/P1 nuclease n=1 Tax=Mesorhizobium sp. AR10 TaxID=2865839 RepID=UPI00215F07AF|nr:S1/P1 nuclease [Mesorhizobium sp. AR10]UVK35807.1 S1/P1 nuclease [Mesorhizobium sp. AR10]
MKPRPSVAALFLLFSSTQAFAWGEDGHSIVAEIAQHRLSESVAKRVQDLLHSEYEKALKGTFSLASIASFADDYRDGNKNTTNWHFVDIPINVPGIKPEDVRYDPKRDCPEATDPFGTCLVEALKQQIDKLSKPATDEATTAERLQALKFVVHLVGDLSQPLHCAHRDGDAGGNGWHVFYSGPHQPPGEIRTNFHKVWDSLILTDGHWNWGEYTNYLEEEWLKGKDETAIAAGDVEGWANECHAAAVKAYRLIPGDLTLSKSQLKEELIIADEQLARGGVRLASILNKALAD